MLTVKYICSFHDGRNKGLICACACGEGRREGGRVILDIIIYVSLFYLIVFFFTSLRCMILSKGHLYVDKLLLRKKYCYTESISRG